MIGVLFGPIITTRQRGTSVSNNPNTPGAVPPGGKPAKSIGDLLREFREHHEQMKRELAKVIVGQEEVIEQLFAAIFTRGHCLLEGVPGLAKTLMVSSLARILDVNFKRIQFTPDLMPSDITGTNVLEEDSQGRREFRFVEGPIFTNILLADEINRTPPKTQAALLQAMQEREVSVGRQTMSLAGPVLYNRYAESDRARRDLPIARSPARPLHVQHHGRLSHGRRRGEDPSIDHARRKTGDSKSSVGPRHIEHPKTRDECRGQSVHCEVCCRPGARHSPW
jgi:hypothetical protein